MIFNREAVIVSLMMLGVLAVLGIGLMMADRERAMDACMDKQSADVCEFTIR